MLPEQPSRLPAGFRFRWSVDVKGAESVLWSSIKVDNREVDKLTLMTNSIVMHIYT